MHADPSLDVVAAIPVGRNLQRQSIEAHAVVVADDAFMLLAQREAQPPGDRWDFNGDDLPFSEVYGKGGTGAGTHPSYQDVGIYVLFGTSSESTQQVQP